MSRVVVSTVRHFGQMISILFCRWPNTPSSSFDWHRTTTLWQRCKSTCADMPTRSQLYKTIFLRYTYSG